MNQQEKGNIGMMYENLEKNGEEQSPKQRNSWFNAQDSPLGQNSDFAFTGSGGNQRKSETTSKVEANLKRGSILKSTKKDHGFEAFPLNESPTSNLSQIHSKGTEAESSALKIEEEFKRRNAQAFVRINTMKERNVTKEVDIKKQRRSVFSGEGAKSKVMPLPIRGRRSILKTSNKFQNIIVADNLEKGVCFGEAMIMRQEEEQQMAIIQKKSRKSLGQLIKSTLGSLKKLPSLFKTESPSSTQSQPQRTFSKITIIARINQAVKKFKGLVRFKSINSLNSKQIKMINDWTWYGEINEKADNKEENNKKNFGILAFLLKLFNKLVGRKKRTRVKIPFLERFETIIEGLPVFNPKSRWKMTWDLLMMLMTFWNFMIISIAISFGVNLEEVFLFKDVKNCRDYYYIFLVFCFINMIVDTLFTMNTSYYEMGALVSDRRKIWRNFAKKGFLINMITQIPFILQILTYHSSLSPQSIKFINTLFFLKYYSLLEIFKILEEFLSLEERSSAFFSLIQLIIKLYFVAHFLGCYWHSVAYFGANPDESTWLTYKNLSIFDFWTERYIYSVYYALTTMTTVGYGDIVPQNPKEVIAAMATMLVGSAMFGYGINSIGELLKKINFKEDQLKRDVRALDRIMKLKKVDYDLHTRARKYLEFIWNEEKIHQENDEILINKLSHTIREEILLQSNGKILKKYPMLYKNFSEKTLRKLINFIKPVRFSPEEIIVEEKDESTDPFLYLITQGEIELSLEVQKRNEEPSSIVTLKEGDAFGEISFFTDLPQLFTARSLNYSTVYKLRKAEFLNVIQGNSEDWEKFCMLRDKIRIYHDYEDLKLLCYSCKSTKHLFFECPAVFYKLSKDKTIERYKQVIKYTRMKRRPLMKPREKKKMNALFDFKAINDNTVQFKVCKEEVSKKEPQMENPKILIKELETKNSPQLLPDTKRRTPRSSFKASTLIFSENPEIGQIRSSLQTRGKTNIFNLDNKEATYQGRRNSVLQGLEALANPVEKVDEQGSKYKDIENTKNNELFMMNFDISKNFAVYFQHNNPEIVVLKMMIKYMKAKKAGAAFGNLSKFLRISLGKRNATSQNPFHFTPRRTVVSPKRSNIRPNFFKDDEQHSN